MCQQFFVYCFKRPGWHRPWWHHSHLNVTWICEDFQPCESTSILFWLQADGDVLFEKGRGRGRGGEALKLKTTKCKNSPAGLTSHSCEMSQLWDTCRNVANYTGKESWTGLLKQSVLKHFVLKCILPPVMKCWAYILEVRKEIKHQMKEWTKTDSSLQQRPGEAIVYFHKVNLHLIHLFTAPANVICDMGAFQNVLQNILQKVATA